MERKNKKEQRKKKEIKKTLIFSLKNKYNANFVNLAFKPNDAII